MRSKLDENIYTLELATKCSILIFLPAKTSAQHLEQNQQPGTGPLLQLRKLIIVIPVLVMRLVIGMVFPVLLVRAAGTCSLRSAGRKTDTYSYGCQQKFRFVHKIFFLKIQKPYQIATSFHPHLLRGAPQGVFRIRQ